MNRSLVQMLAIVSLLGSGSLAMAANDMPAKQAQATQMVSSKAGHHSKQKASKPAAAKASSGHHRAKASSK
jgi:hypothetical protein